MSAYHQVGDRSANLFEEADLNRFRGAILSPVNYDLKDTMLQAMRAGKIKNFRRIFDPQLYCPKTDRAKLRQWDYFPKDFATADSADEAWWVKLVDKLVGVCKALTIDAICSPAIIPRIYSNDYYDTSVYIGDLLFDKVAGTPFKAIQTAVVSFSELSSPTRPYAIASVLSRTKASEVFLVLVGDTAPRREISDTEGIKGAMRLIGALESAGLHVIVGFCSTDIVLWKAAGATSCASGKFFNLRRFTESRFAESEGGGQLPYWIEESLLAYLRESDVIRVRDVGLFSEATKANPYTEAILKRIDQKPGKPWQSLSWSQFMYWFSDIESRLSNKLIDVPAFLEQAETNWVLLGEKKVLMEEIPNNGKWLRAWRRAVLEFNP